MRDVQLSRLKSSMTMVAALIVVHAAVVLGGAALAFAGDSSLLWTEVKALGAFDTLLAWAFALLPVALLVDQASVRFAAGVNLVSVIGDPSAHRTCFCAQH
ncbi:MAG: hypothetical protein WKF52_06405 [Sphingomicrobium sp.]